jgi:hypothetical protein
MNPNYIESYHEPVLNPQIKPVQGSYGQVVTMQKSPSSQRLVK